MAVVGESLFLWWVFALTDVYGNFCELVVSARARSAVDVCRKLLLLPGKGVGFLVCDFIFLWAHVVIEVCGSFGGSVVMVGAWSVCCYL